MTTRAIARMTALCGALVVATTACGRSGAPASQPSPDDDRSNRTTSVTELGEADFENLRVGRIEQMLEGRVAGLQVVRLPNGEFSLRIRGVSSLSGPSEPLIVIDGMPVNHRSTRVALAGLNPRDVDRIEVLKDAGSTAIYGMRGANGVILITTKRNNR